MKRAATENRAEDWFYRTTSRGSSIAAAAVLVAACGGADLGQGNGASSETVASTEAAVTATEDGLADAYALFKELFQGIFFNPDFAQDLPMGYGFHEGLSTEKLPP